MKAHCKTVEALGKKCFNGVNLKKRREPCRQRHGSRGGGRGTLGDGRDERWGEGGRSWGWVLRKRRRRRGAQRRKPVRRQQNPYLRDTVCLCIFWSISLFSGKKILGRCFREKKNIHLPPAAEIEGSLDGLSAHPHLYPKGLLCFPGGGGKMTKASNLEENSAEKGSQKGGRGDGFNGILDEE